MSEVLLCEVDNIKMKYFSFGNGNKTMIMLPGVSLNSVMLSKDIIAKAYEMFTNEFTVYVFDRKLYMEEGYSTYDMAKDTIKVIDNLGLKELYVLGASQGGMMALYMGIIRPDLFKKINICASTPKFSNNSFKLMNEMVELAKKNMKYELVDSFCKLIYTKEFYESIKGALNEFSDTLTSNDIDRLIISINSLKGFDVCDDLNKIQCPILAIGAKLDPIMDNNDLKLIKDNCDSEIYIYDNYSHAVYDEAKDIKERIYEFFLK